MAQRKTLTEKQVEILRWIADGCPSGVMPDTHHRISAAALERRGLVETYGRRSGWTASVTRDGREYLRKVDGEDPPVPRQANVSVTQQLVDEVLAAGGVLRVPVDGRGDQSQYDYQRRARLAAIHGKVPEGRQLIVVCVQGELELRLVDTHGIEGRRSGPEVVVPARVGRYHPAARGFRDNPGRHEVSRAAVSRATKIIHTIAKAADARGWVASSPSESKNGHGRMDWTGTKDGHLRVEVSDEAFWFRLREKGVRTRGPWERDVHSFRNVKDDDPWWQDRTIPRGPYDADGTGRLTLELLSDDWAFSGRRSRWADGQSQRLEDLIPGVVKEIEDRLVESEQVAEQERLAAERAAEEERQRAEERQRRWQELMDQARRDYHEAFLAAHLRAQAEVVHEVELIRRYCDKAEAAFGGVAETSDWLAWAREYATQRDPLTMPPGAPDVPEPTPEDLQGHLPDGWSAEGPDRYVGAERTGRTHGHSGFGNSHFGFGGRA